MGGSRSIAISSEGGREASATGHRVIPETGGSSWDPQSVDARLEQDRRIALDRLLAAAGGRKPMTSGRSCTAGRHSTRSVRDYWPRCFAAALSYMATWSDDESPSPTWVLRKHVLLHPERSFSNHAGTNRKV